MDDVLLQVKSIFHLDTNLSFLQMRWAQAKSQLPNGVLRTLSKRLSPVKARVVLCLGLSYGLVLSTNTHSEH